MIKKLLMLCLLLFAVVLYGEEAAITLPDWAVELRKEHPRLLLNSDQLPEIRNYAATKGRGEFERLQKYNHYHLSRHRRQTIRPNYVGSRCRRADTHEGNIQIVPKLLYFLVISVIYNCLFRFRSLGYCRGV